MKLAKRYTRIFELAKPYLNTRKNDVHTEIVYNFAIKLLHKERGNPEVVIPAVLLHDVGWIKVPEELQLKAFGPGPIDLDTRRIHEVEGVKLAKSILSQVGYDPKQTEEILQIVDGHDSRLEALSLNDKLVKDADKLFRFSDQGFAIDCERFDLDPASRVIELYANIESWMFTKTARVLAKAELDKKNVVKLAT